MDKDFEKQMKEKFSEASLNDIMPGFDKLQTWNELDTKLSRKKRIVPVWFNYAAAVAVGLFIGGGVIKTWMNDNNVTQQIVVKNNDAPVSHQPKVINTPKQEKVEDDNTNKNIAVAASMPKRHIDTDRKIEKSNTTTKAVIADTKYEIAAVVPSANADTLLPVKQLVVVKAPVVKKKKTVHLLDIMNEDRTTVLNDANTGDTYIPNIVRQLSPPRAVVKNKEDNRHLVIRTLLNN